MTEVRLEGLLDAQPLHHLVALLAVAHPVGHVAAVHENLALELQLPEAFVRFSHLALERQRDKMERIAEVRPG